MAIVGGVIGALSTIATIYDRLSSDADRKDGQTYNDILNKMKRQIRLNCRQHSATMHYVNNYGYIPMWVSVKVLSFGIMAELYTILKEDDQNIPKKVSNFSLII